jgi:hypothetical protein
MTMAFTAVVLLAAWQGQRFSRQALPKKGRDGEGLSQRDAVNSGENEQLMVPDMCLRAP